MAGYDIWDCEIRLWWSSSKRECPRCGAKCRNGSSCNAPPVWNRRLDRPVNGHRRMHQCLQAPATAPLPHYRTTLQTASTGKARHLLRKNPGSLGSVQESTCYRSGQPLLTQR